jgi:cob(I)alamin adenosyltransferase
MKIYTKTGDDGSTGLFGGQRVPKHDSRVRAFGAVDELNSAIGLTITAGGDDQIRAMLTARQSELFSLGAMLAAADGKAAGAGISEPQIIALEHEIDRMDAELDPLRNFILPGGCALAAWLHFARTVCRSAEREVSDLRAERTKDAVRLSPALKYLNRLSDWLFTLARIANKRAGIEDIPWKGGNA